MTETMTTSSTGGQKGVKLARYDLIPVDALRQVAEHYGKGAQKYSDNNWRKGYEYSKAYAALQRHAQAWWGGEDVDEETGSSHLAAVAFHAMSLMTFLVEHPEFDDRYIHRTPTTAPMVDMGSIQSNVDAWAERATGTRKDLPA